MRPCELHKLTILEEAVQVHAIEVESADVDAVGARYVRRKGHDHYSNNRMAEIPPVKVEI
jgi:hypothetical protein